MATRSNLSIVLDNNEHERRFAAALLRASQISDEMIFIRSSVRNGKITKSISTRSAGAMAVLISSFNRGEQHA